MSFITGFNLSSYNLLLSELLKCVNHNFTNNWTFVTRTFQDDHNYWQARKVAVSGSAGLIPSPELQEWRTACAAAEKSKNGNGDVGGTGDGINCSIFKKKRMMSKDK